MYKIMKGLKVVKWDKKSKVKDIEDIVELQQRRLKKQKDITLL